MSTLQYVWLHVWNCMSLGIMGHIFVYLFDFLFHQLPGTQIHTHRGPRAPEYHRVADRHYFLIWIKCPSDAACVDLFSHSAQLRMGLMGCWLPGGWSSMEGLSPVGDLYWNIDWEVIFLRITASPHSEMFTFLWEFLHFPECFSATSLDLFKRRLAKVRGKVESLSIWQQTFLVNPFSQKNNPSLSCSEFWSTEATVTRKLDILFYNRFLPLSLFVTVYKNLVLWFQVTGTRGLFQCHRNMPGYQTPLWLSTL